MKWILIRYWWGQIVRVQHQAAMFRVRCDRRIRWASSIHFRIFGRSHTPAGGIYGLIRYTTSALTKPQIKYWMVQISNPTYHLVYEALFPLQHSGHQMECHFDYFMLLRFWALQWVCNTVAWINILQWKKRCCGRNWAPRKLQVSL